MIADVRDMRRGFLTAGSQGRSHKMGAGKLADSNGKRGSKFIQRFGATVRETFIEWRRWGWPAVETVQSPKPLPRQEFEEPISQIGLSQEDGRMIVRINLPGPRQERLRIEVYDGVLMVSGVCHWESEGGKGRVETFFRSLTLPEGTNGQDIQTELIDGLLRISIALPGHESRTFTRAVVM